MTIYDVCKDLKRDTLVYIHAWHGGDASEVKNRLIVDYVLDNEDLKDMPVAFTLDGKDGISIFVKADDYVIVDKEEFVINAISKWFEDHAEDFGCTKDNVLDYHDVWTFGGSDALWMQTGDEINIWYDDYRDVYKLIVKDGIDAFMSDVF